MRKLIISNQLEGRNKTHLRVHVKNDNEKLLIPPFEKGIKEISNDETKISVHFGFYSARTPIVKGEEDVAFDIVINPRNTKILMFQVVCILLSFFSTLAFKGALAVILGFFFSFLVIYLTILSSRSYFLFKASEKE